MRNFFTAASKLDLKRCYLVMKELRSKLTFAEYLKIYEQIHKTDKYEIIAIEQDGEILALMGYRINFDFVRGKHLYIDDLVTTEKYRSTGLGAQLLSYAETIARDLDCGTLRLCTGLENEGGIKFYDRNGWLKTAFAYTKKVRC